MLKNQMIEQNAKELAIHYLSATGTAGTPEEYLILLRKLEQDFLKLLKQQSNGN
ncbi:hypothetical protein UXO11_22305 [Enterobacter wuhouensis]|uniref:hypothetical protein n=1 Tax=Enterobacter wuhouensis TaxID=2529381 RepID=UPI002FD59ABF